jgi:hypothetical protein
LRALDLRREHGLLADVRREELVRVGKEERDPVEAPESLISPVEEILRVRIDRESRIRWQWFGVERVVALAA